MRPHDTVAARNACHNSGLARLSIMGSSESFDAIVVGSGGAALTAAFVTARAGLRTVVLESTDKLGGTTALSGGLIYAPHSRLALDAGIDIPRQQVLTYLGAVARKPVKQELLTAFLDTAPAAVDALAAGGVQFRLTGIPDYYAEKPGAASGGHVLGTQPFDPKGLGEWAAKIRRSPYRDQDENPWVSGTSVAGSLVAAGLKAGVEFRTGTAVTDLVMAADGAVAGVRAKTPAGDAEFAGRGVVIASGGYEFAPELVGEYLDGILEGSWANPGNTGVAIRLARQAGAALDGLGEGQWYPHLKLTDGTYDGAPLFDDCGARNLPGSIFVNAAGQRFVNEATVFQEVGRALSSRDPKNLPAWLVIDQQYVDSYGERAFGPNLDTSSKHWHKAESLAGLAASTGVPADALEATVARFNDGAAEGKDPDFGRGEGAIDRGWGDTAKEGGFTTLAPIATAPYYATRVYSGASGATGGPKIDGRARVLRPDGTPVPGLYAAGNATATFFGEAAPASGSTLGPGITLGYTAGTGIAESVNTGRGTV
jgi:succinate dehydrogenase/fumarate reductase flavoprotein subunit